VEVTRKLKYVPKEIEVVLQRRVAESATLIWWRAAPTGFILPEDTGSSAVGLSR